jgi:hypothetical protein
MLELVVLLVCIIIVLLSIYNIQSENFENQHKPSKPSSNDYQLHACPTGYKLHYNSNSDTICCNGDFMNDRCIDGKQCILNGKGTNTVHNCVDFILKDYEIKGLESCPRLIPSYFEDTVKKIRGCTNGRYNTTLTGPNTNKQPTCHIYSDEMKNKSEVDSCYNEKELEKTECFGSDCEKGITSFGQGPAVIYTKFADNTGIHRYAYTRKSAEDYLDVIEPRWKEKGFINVDRNLIISEVARGYYIDKTINKDGVDI